MALWGMPSELTIWTMAFSINFSFLSTTTPVTKLGCLGEAGRVIFLGLVVGMAVLETGAVGLVKMTFWGITGAGEVCSDFGISMLTILGVFRITSATSLTGLSLRTEMAGFSIISSTTVGLLLVLMGDEGSELKSESRDLTIFVSFSDKSEIVVALDSAIGALMVLVIVLTTSGGWAVKRKSLGILLVFCQVKRVGR